MSHAYPAEIIQLVFSSIAVAYSWLNFLDAKQTLDVLGHAGINGDKRAIALLHVRNAKLGFGVNFALAFLGLVGVTSAPPPFPFAEELARQIVRNMWLLRTTLACISIAHAYGASRERSDRRAMVAAIAARAQRRHKTTPISFSDRRHDGSEHD